MTTKVTVDAHAGWPVKVVRVYQKGYGYLNNTEVIVPAYTTQDFYPHAGMHLEIYEEPEWTAGAGECNA